MATIPQDGILLVHKPVGPTSHDMVDRVRRLTGIQRVGHAGTLDPFAEGLLIILVGRESTRRQDEFLGMDKTYEAQIRLGARSTTDDCTGEITQAIHPDPPPTNADIQKVLSSFIGSHDQIPPQYSAKKIKGRKSYELARKGIHVPLTPKNITIKEIEILQYNWPILSLKTTVSSGAYIRALARDIGEKLGCGAYVEKLIRTRIGSFHLSDAVTLNDEMSK